MSEQDGAASLVRSDALLAELQFYRFEAEMRAKCDDCETKRVMVALGNDGVWRCFECTHKANAAGEVRRNAVTSTGLLAVSESGDK